MPLAAIFAFKCEISVTGLLGGLMFGTTLHAVSYQVLILRANWQEIADAAVERIRKEKEEVENAKTEKFSDVYEA